MTTRDFLDILGKPFAQGGRDPSVGIGCWGLVREVLKRMGKDVPDPWEQLDQTRCNTPELADEVASGRFFERVLDGMQESWDPVPVEAAAEGDVILFRDDRGMVAHAGVLLADGTMIHSRRGIGVHALPWERTKAKASEVLRWRPTG